MKRAVFSDKHNRVEPKPYGHIRVRRKSVPAVKIFLFGLFTFLLLQSTGAQDVKFVASAPAVVEVGEQFQLTYTINKNASGLKVPSFSNFNFLGGPTQYQNSSSQMINGKFTQTFELGFTYFLQAAKIGIYTFPPAQITVAGKTYESNPVKIEVIKGSKPAPSSTGQNTNSSQAPTDYSGEDLFVRVLVDKTSVYLGEPVFATVKIFNRLNLSQIANAVPPSFTGFYKNDIDVPPLNRLQRENVNGHIYGTGVIQRFVLYPQKTGQLVIDPYQLECVIQQAAKQQGNGFFDDFFGPSVENISKTIESKPVRITVKPLPEPKPADFDGSVGDYYMKVTSTKTELKANDALTLRVEIGGTGNIKLLESPKVSFPPDFDTYDPKITTNVDKSGNSGSRIFEYLAIPRHEGSFRIPPVKFAYFNPISGTYKNINSEAVDIHVLKGDSTASAGVVSGLSKEDVRYLGSDIRFIKTGNIVLRPIGKTLASSYWFYLFYPFTLLLFAVLVIWRRKKIRENADLALVKNRRANKVALKRLKQAEKLLTGNRREEFYDELIRAVYGYLSDKLRIPLAELSLEKALNELNARKTDQQLLQDLSEMVDRCQFARYAPVSEGYSMKDDYQKTAVMIRKLEQNLR